MLPDWNRWYPNCEPVCDHLWLAFPDRWVRFHSLPGSKRYPENEAEYAEVLARHNCILSELAQPGERVVLLTTGYSESSVPTRYYTQLSDIDPGAALWRTITMHRPEEALTYPNYWHVFASIWEWQRGTFDRLVRLVADDVLANVLVVASDCRWVLLPYDGGMDVFAESSAARDSLKAQHSTWLSSRPDGL